MLGQTSFIACITEQLAERGFGKGTTDALVARFKKFQAGYEAGGMNPADAATLAASDLFGQLSAEKKQKAKRLLKTLAVHAQAAERVQAAAGADLSKLALDGRVNVGTAMARAAVSMIEHDPRFPGPSYSTTKETVRGQLWAIMGDVLDKIGKGAFGVQRGKAHLPNIVRELFGVNTGDSVAREVATAYTKTQDVAVELFNTAGGSMLKLAGYHLPQAHSAVKLLRVGVQKFVDFHMNALDWGKMRHPDGSPIAPAERDAYLREVFETQSTDGANKLKPGVRGMGRAVGNQLENHRQLVYKDADAWLQQHEMFGEGNVFEVIAGHIEDFAHKIALVETFGPNPELMKKSLGELVRREAAKTGDDRAVTSADATIKNVFDPMMDVILRDNPMDPHDFMGAATTGLANILTAAQLGSAFFPAMLGDLAQTTAVRALNNMNPFGGVGFYFKMLASDVKFQRRIAAQSGFIADDAVMATYAAQRFTGTATYGPAVTRRISDTVMRASLLSGHTRAARWATTAEFMGLMARDAGTAFDDLAWKSVAERYGITSAEWDAFRATQTYSPRAGVEFLRPIDVLKTGGASADKLYRKFQGMLVEESRKMVPESTIEASVYLKDTTRPDTLRGAILYSFAMYKNFPVSMLMIYGRLALTKEGLTRAGFIAGLAAAMTLVGGLATQMREVAKGRDPLPMDTWDFLGKAALSGGALSIFGDFMFSGVNQFGRGPADAVAGPVFGFVKDGSQLALGELFERIGKNEWVDGEFGTDTAARAVEFARRYTPGTSLWWSRVAMERLFFDRLQELADPRAYQTWARKERRQQNDFGNDYWWRPGDVAPARLPTYEGAQ